jgi:hypothetical protein
VFSYIAAFGIVEFLNWHSGPILDSSHVPILSQLIINEKPLQHVVPIYTTGPNYFNSIARVYVCLSSPYIDNFEQFKIEASVDDINWKTLSTFSAFPKDNQLERYTDLGLVDLNSLTIRVNIRSTIPPQGFSVPPGVTKETLSNSFIGSMIVKKLSSPRDKIIKLLIVITIWNVIIKLLDMLIIK